MTPAQPILALDVGTKRTGVALNPTGMVILELPTFHYRSDQEFRSHLQQIIRQQQPQTVVVGRARTTLLQEGLDDVLSSVAVHYLDETLTTKEAERQLVAEGQASLPAGRQGDSDARSARLILEQYLRQVKSEE